MSKEKLLINDSKSNNSKVMSNSGDCKKCNSQEKQIEEMARDICRVKQSCNDVCHPINSCRALKYAERFYNAGYRKQSEVAKEMFSWFEENAVNLNFITGNFEINLANYLELKKKYFNCTTCKHLVSCEPNTSGNFDCWEEKK